jgi:hypothetical protein
MIHGIFDFFCGAAAGGNGAEGAGVAGCGTTTSAVFTFFSTGGGGGGGGGGAGEVTGCFDISDVLGLVGPVLRGSATVAG